MLEQENVKTRRLAAALDHLTHEICHDGLHGICCNLYFFVAYLNNLAFHAKVGDDGDAEDTDACVVRYDNFGHSGHADCVATQTMIHTIFSGGLKSGTLSAYIHSFDVADAFSFAMVRANWSNSGL